MKNNKNIFSDDRIIIVTTVNMKNSLHWLDIVKFKNVYVIELDTLENDNKYELKDSKYLFTRITNILSGKEEPIKINESDG